MNDSVCMDLIHSDLYMCTFSVLWQSPFLLVTYLIILWQHSVKEHLVVANNYKDCKAILNTATICYYIFNILGNSVITGLLVYTLYLLVTLLHCIVCEYSMY